MRNTSYGQAVAAEVRAHAARKGFSQNQIALATGIPVSTLHRKLRGTYPFLITELGDVAEALGVDVRELMPPLSGAAA